jgi:hypothetical protein
MRTSVRASVVLPLPLSPTVRGVALADRQVDDVDCALALRGAADEVDPRSLDGKMHRHAGDLDQGRAELATAGSCRGLHDAFGMGRQAVR